MRISGRTVGHIIARVAGEAGAGTDRLAGLRRIGIDEISYKKGHETWSSWSTTTPGG